MNDFQNVCAFRLLYGVEGNHLPAEAKRKGRESASGCPNFLTGLSKDLVSYLKAANLERPGTVVEVVVVATLAPKWPIMKPTVNYERCSGDC